MKEKRWLFVIIKCYCCFLDLVMKGIGFHHAGMDIQDRKYMEELFAAGDLFVLGKSITMSDVQNFSSLILLQFIYSFLAKAFKFWAFLYTKKVNMTTYHATSFYIYITTKCVSFLSHLKEIKLIFYVP